MVSDKNNVPLKVGSTVQFAFNDLFEPQQRHFDNLITDKTKPVRGTVWAIHEGDKHTGEDPHGRGAVDDAYTELTGHLPAAIEIEVVIGKQATHFPFDPAKCEVKGK
jgi:hypothetical protein